MLHSLRSVSLTISANSVTLSAHFCFAEVVVLEELEVVIDGASLTVSLNKMLLGILSDRGVTVQDLLDVYNTFEPAPVEGAVNAVFAFQADPTPDQIAETVCLHYVRYNWELL